MESIRQQQLAKTINVALSEIFQRELDEILNGAMATILSVNVTPDLQIARVYLSIYNASNPDEIVETIQHNTKGIRGLLGRKIRNKVRTIPEVEFYRDNTMDEVIKIEELFKDIKQQDEKVEKLRDKSDYVDNNPYKEDV